MDRRKSPLVPEGTYALPRELAQRRRQRMLNAWLSGKSYAEVGATAGDGRQVSEEGRLTADQARAVIRQHAKVLWETHRKWKLAEIRCHAMAMELQLLRLGREAQPDRPIEAIEPPDCWRKAFRLAGIETVNQLRSVDSEMLLARWQFPRGAIDWAVLKLDRLGLSHRLTRPKRAQIPRLGKRTVR